MHMPEGDPHPSTMPGFRGTIDPERSVTRSRSRRKKKRVKFEDVQPQFIPNPIQENFSRRCITQLPDRVSHIYYTGRELTNQDSMRVNGTFTMVIKVWKEISTIPPVRNAVVNIFGQFIDIRLGNSDNRLIQYWFYEYCEVGHPIVKEDAKYSAYSRLRAWERGNRKKTNDQTTNLFILGRYYIDRHTIDTITWELWLESEIKDVLTAKLISQSARETQRLQELTDELDIAHWQINSIDYQLYAHDLQLRRGCDVRVVQLPPGGGARMKHRGSGPRTRGGGTNRRGRVLEMIMSRYTYFLCLCRRCRSLAITTSIYFLVFLFCFPLFIFYNPSCRLARIVFGRVCVMFISHDYLMLKLIEVFRYLTICLFK
ncbi:hypothetical protein GIB67_040710 [Kingdonia uniflora]|uniref:Uncharacterized protein n=1 Tax=Kingdonia uniflora TaxID=39325 RepID=A0A7J7KUB6_9MAGN|nr:hypothetical protein GIB67_040710 [Kingdonia uniflora]